MSLTTDQQLIDLTLTGEISSFGKLVERYQDFVFTIAFRILKVREEAEEVAQDSFIKAYTSLKSFRGESKFSSWLYSIVYRKALDALRKSKKYKASQIIDDITEGEVDGIEDALHYLEEMERKRAIQDCILKLSEDEGAIITFYYFQDQSVREIAAITGLSEENIKVKLYRSRKKLYGFLKYFILPEITNTNGRAI